MFWDSVNHAINSGAFYPPPYPVLVTGFPRSGTRFMVDVFQDQGLRVGHEWIGKDGAVSWIHAVLNNSFDHTVHLVRHPLEAISSCQELGQEVLDFMRIFIPVPEEAPEVIQWVYAWVEWNKMIEKRVSIRCRIEDIEEALPGIFSLIGKKYTRRPLPFPDSGRKREYKMLSTEEIAARREGPAALQLLDKKATEYGYTLQEKSS